MNNHYIEFVRKYFRDLTIRDPIHGMMTFPANSVVRRLIDTKEFQRLRRIKQLGFSDFVYPGATHTRFSHSLGVAWLVQKAVRQLFSRSKEDGGIELSDFEGYESEKQVIDAMACAGLLHDIGHGPFSHTFEGFIKTSFDIKHEGIAGLIIEDNTEVSKILKRSISKKIFPKTALSDIKKLIVDTNYGEDKKLETKEGEGELSKLQILASLIGSQLDCDRLDFLLRDTYFCGTHLHVDIDYIFRSMLVKDVFGVGKRVVFEKKAVPVIEQFLLSRIFHYENIAYHKTTRGVEVLCHQIFQKLKLKKLLENKDTGGDYVELEEPRLLDLKKYCDFTDSTIISELEIMAKNGRVNSKTRHDIKNFFNRILFKEIDEKHISKHDEGYILNGTKEKVFSDTPDNKVLYSFDEKNYTTLKTLYNYKHDFNPVNNNPDDKGAYDSNKKKYSELIKKIKENIFIFDKDKTDFDGLGDISEYSEVVRNLKGIEQQNRYYSTEEARNQLRSITKGDNDGENAQ